MADNTAAETAETNEERLQRSRRKLRVGVVTSDKMQKTVVVTVKSLVRHAVYGRTLRQHKKFKAHDELGDAHVGDTVEIMETRPISKDKRWRVVRVIERAK
jgi:small subunit ribosomal protein S17